MHTASLPLRDPQRSLAVATAEPAVVIDATGTIVDWNRALEELTGIRGEAAVGQPCFAVLGARSAGGAPLCRDHCTVGRAARAGWPVRRTLVDVPAAGGTRMRAWLSTVALAPSDARPLILHLVHPDGEEEPAATPGAGEREARLTPRQLEVLRLLADGVRAKMIAERLVISETTVRNHIRAILAELGAHSQLGAVAAARRRGILDR